MSLKQVFSLYTKLTFLFLILLSLEAHAELNVIVHENKLYVDGEEFWIKGIAYRPTPLAYKDDAKSAAGLCSIRLTPWNEKLSACYDLDFFDGGPYTNPDADGENWFLPVWERDFLFIKEAGFNTLRLYNVNSTTKQASIDLLGKWGKIQVPNGKEHVTFMDYVHDKEMFVIFPFPPSSSTENIEDSKQKIRNLIDEVGNHPALLMWTISKEIQSQGSHTELLSEEVNMLMDYVRDYMLKKWDRQIPVTTCIPYHPNSIDTMVSTLNVDVFCINLGHWNEDFGGLLSGSEKNNVPSWEYLATKYKKPLLIGELGRSNEFNTSLIPIVPDGDNDTDSDDDTESYHITWFNSMYVDLLKHFEDGLIGLVIFEYSDQPKSNEGESFGIVAFTEHIEDSFSSITTVDYYVPDKVALKPLFFSIQKGQPINMNTDIYEYLQFLPLILPVEEGTSSTVDDTTDANTEDKTTSASSTFKLYPPKVFFIVALVSTLLFQL